MGGILDDKEDCYLIGDCEDRWEWDTSRQSTELCYGVEEPDLGQLNEEVGEEDVACAIPLFCWGGDFCLRKAVSGDRFGLRIPSSHSVFCICSGTARGLLSSMGYNVRSTQVRA